MHLRGSSADIERGPLEKTHSLSVRTAPREVNMLVYCRK